MEKKFYIGEIAKSTNLTVRTLQHYDNIGLLPASGREASGRRYYTTNDVLKLEQIQFYKLLGFSLSEIKEKVVNSPSLKELEKLFCEHVQMIYQKIEQFYTVLGSLNASLLTISMGKYPPPALLSDLILSLNKACILTWAPELFSEQDIELFNDIDAAYLLYHRWKSLSIEAAMLKELHIQPDDKYAQNLAARFYDMIMKATKGNKQEYEVFERFNKKRFQWAAGEAKLVNVSEDYLTSALKVYIRKNNINVPDFLRDLKD